MKKIGGHHELKIQIRRLNELPSGFDDLVAESQVQGHEFSSRTFRLLRLRTHTPEACDLYESLGFSRIPNETDRAHFYFEIETNDG